MIDLNDENTHTKFCTSFHNARLPNIFTKREREILTSVELYFI